jgi:hypothetical protein
MKCIQVDFYHTTKSNGITQTTAWVDIMHKLKPGKIVSFTDRPNVKWTVGRVGTIIHDYQEIQHEWGLSLPKSQRTER